MAFSPDGKTLAAGGWGDNTVKLWNVATGEQIASLEGHDKTINGLAFSPEGNILASGSNDNTVKLWDVAARKETIALEGHSNAVRSIAFSRATRRRWLRGPRRLDGQTLGRGIPKTRVATLRHMVEASFQWLFHPMEPRWQPGNLAKD